MLVTRTIEEPAHPLGKFVCSEESVWLDDLALRVNPFRLDGVQPRTLLRKQTTHDPHPKAALLDAAVVLAEPPPDLLRDVPTRVVPDEQQNLLSGRLELFQDPLEEPRRYGTHRPSVHEPQPRLIELWKVEALAGYGLRLGVIFGNRALDEARRRPLLGGPGVLKVGSATRLHQHSSQKPMAHSGSAPAAS